jgi:eukaryotic-like serine/threonine-protein kinase
MGDRRSVDDVRPFAELSRSSTAVVYKAYQASHERVVLLKRLLPEAVLDARVVGRFEDESRLIARINHPNVVALHSFGSDATSPYLVAEFVDGLNLSEVIALGAIPVPVAVFMLREAVRGIGAAHDGGVLHRDIKPANILISFQGEVKVADFGFASLLHEHEQRQEVRGTLPYLAPEQVKGEAPSVGSDFFALGATFFEMLTARRAFLGSDSGAILEAVLHYDPVPQLAARSDVPAEVIAICGRLLTRFAQERYDDWREVEADCTSYLASLDSAVDEASIEAYLEDPASFVAPKAGQPDAKLTSDHGDVAPDTRDWRIAVPAAVMAFTILFVVAALSGYFGRGEAGDALASRALDDVRYPLWLYPLGPDGREAVEDATEADEEEAESEAEMTPADMRGALRIRVDPWAVVVLGGDTLGRTPLADRIYVGAGRHRLTFLHPEFPAHEQFVTVRPRGDHEINVSMWDGVGRLSIEVSPWAAVSIDGIPRDTIPPQRRPYVLAPGTYSLSLEHPVLGRYVTEVDLSAGEQRTLRFNLYDLLR